VYPGELTVPWKQKHADEWLLVLGRCFCSFWYTLMWGPLTPKEFSKEKKNYTPHKKVGERNATLEGETRTHTHTRLQCIHENITARIFLPKNKKHTNHLYINAHPFFFFLSCLYFFFWPGRQEKMLITFTRKYRHSQLSYWDAHQHAWVFLEGGDRNYSLKLLLLLWTGKKSERETTHAKRRGAVNPGITKQLLKTEWEKERRIPRGKK